MSLGSQSGNRHIHWHVAPPPPGIPYQDQQFAAFSWDRGVLALPDQDLASLARRIGTGSSSCITPAEHGGHLGPHAT